MSITTTPCGITAFDWLPGLSLAGKAGHPRLSLLPAVLRRQRFCPDCEHVHRPAACVWLDQMMDSHRELHEEELR
jgi:hypothetical protein